ncbi:MAG: flavodoxin family protein [Coriobacteriia bacterium]|nr:flavodoxin family protein [Coriobacteriia bacterium]
MSGDETSAHPGVTLSRPLVLGIAGSPRRGGNSDTLLAEALAGAAEAGAATDTLVAAELGLAPCRGCNTCSRTGECILGDPWRDVFTRIDGADALIVASPVYFATVPAVLKVLYDRMQPYWARTHVLGRERPVRRPGAILLARAGGDPYGFDAAEATTRSVLAVLGIDVLDALKVAGLDAAGDVEQHPAALTGARVLGGAVALEAISRQSG